MKPLQRISARIRQVGPKVKILVRGDRGFCREPTLAWCAANDVDSLFGLAQNPRLLRRIAEPLEPARRQFEATQQPTGVCADLRSETRDSGSRERRVVAQAEHLEKGANRRFVVPALGREEHPAQELSEETYCSRGAMENRIQEQQLHRFADRTSAETMRAHPIRWFVSSLASTLREALRRWGRTETSMARAQGPTIRLKLLTIGALVPGTVRKVGVRLASSGPSADGCRHAFTNLDRLRPVMLRGCCEADARRRSRRHTREGRS